MILTITRTTVVVTSLDDDRDPQAEWRALNDIDPYDQIVLFGNSDSESNSNSRDRDDNGDSDNESEEEDREHRNVRD
jgi:hypothetical protein